MGEFQEDFEEYEDDTGGFDEPAELDPEFEDEFGEPDSGDSEIRRDEESAAGAEEDGNGEEQLRAKEAEEYSRRKVEEMMRRKAEAKLAEWGLSALAPYLVPIAGALLLVLVIGVSMLGFFGGLNDPAIANPIDSSTVSGKVAQVAFQEYQKNVTEKCDNNCDSNIELYQREGGGCYNQAWCAAFVSYVFNKAGAEGPRTCGALEAINYFERGHQQFSIESEAPQPGDVLYRPREGGSGHVGIVYEIKGSILITIEGNAGDRVSKNEYRNYGRDSWTLIGRY